MEKMDEKNKNVQPVDNQAKVAEPKKQVAKKSKPNFLVRFFRWVGRKFKETYSELKKVTWPKFPKVVKQTGVVLGVILIFLVLVTGIDYGLQALLTLVTTH